MLRSLRAVQPSVSSAAQAVRSTHPRGHVISSSTAAGAGLRRCAGWLVAFFIVALPQAAHAGAYASANQRAAQWLETQQDWSDGSWRDTSEARTFLQTTEAVLALHQANRRQAAYYAGQTWIENQDPKNLDARARRLLVLRATQSSAQPDIDALLAAVSTPVAGQSGWGLAKRYRAAPLDTALALDALRTVGATFSSSQAIAYLKATQLTLANDRGWPTAAGSATDAYTTARVVQALAAYKGSDATLTTPLANAVATLKTKVTTSSAPHVRAATALAYLRMDPASNDAMSLLNSLTALQRADGGFDAGVFATGLIAQAFAAAEGADATASRVRVDLPDAALHAAINEALGRGAMDALNKGELASLTSLTAVGRGIASLAGLEWAVNLTYLDVRNNNITSTAPIAALAQLTTTLLAGNPVYVPPNRAPTLLADSAVTVGGYPVLLYVLANDVDPDGDPISLVSTTSAAHGVAQAIGSTIKYTANDAYAGADSFSYTAKDSKGATATTTVTLTVYAKSSDEDGDGVSNYDEMNLARNIFVNENAVLLLLRKALKM